MTAPLILSIGEAMVELSQAGQHGLWQQGIAGDTLNTAWYLRRLLSGHWRVGYLSRVGLGEFSQQMMDFLALEGIETAYVSRDSRHEIGLYAISLRNGERSFSYWREQSAARRLADDPQPLERALTGAHTAYLSGITLAILPEHSRNNLMQALLRARSQGTRLVFDSNLRPHLWPDSASMCHQIEAMAAHADLILPSFDDENRYFGDPDPQTTLARYLACGARQVVVKAGGAAVYYGGVEGQGVVEGLVRETPVDTTSAGDSFNAAYLAARLEREADIPTAIRCAHELSRKVILHHGALVRQALS